MKKTILVAVLSLIVSGCIGFEHKSSATGPSAAGIGALMGNWSSSNIIPSPTTCTDFKWNALRADQHHAPKGRSAPRAPGTSS
jgi:hypothetical protein